MRRGSEYGGPDSEYTWRPCRAHDAKHPADLLACEECGRERKATDDEVDRCELVAACDRETCKGWMEWKWNAVGWCPNCEKLGPHDHQALKGCCSRACLLQFEYAQALETASAHGGGPDGSPTCPR